MIWARVRARVRAWLLRRLGYEPAPIPYLPALISCAGTPHHAAYEIEESAYRWLPVGIKLEICQRRVPEVPPGTVRVVLEVHQ